MLQFIKLSDKVHINANAIESIEVCEDHSNDTEFARIITKSDNEYITDDVQTLFSKLSTLIRNEEECMRRRDVYAIDE